MSCSPDGAQAFDGLVELGGGGARIAHARSDRQAPFGPRSAKAIWARPRVNVSSAMASNRIVPPRNLAWSRAARSRASAASPLRQQQVAVPISLHRIQQADFAAATSSAAAPRRRIDPQPFPTRRRRGAHRHGSCDCPSSEMRSPRGPQRRPTFPPSPQRRRCHQPAVRFRSDSKRRSPAFVQACASSSIRRAARIAGSASRRRPCARNPKLASPRTQAAVRRRQRGGRRFIRPVEEPGDRREIAADGAQFCRA